MFAMPCSDLTLFIAKKLKEAESKLVKNKE